MAIYETHLISSREIHTTNRRLQLFDICNGRWISMMNQLYARNCWSSPKIIGWLSFSSSVVFFSVSGKLQQRAREMDLVNPTYGPLNRNQFIHTKLASSIFDDTILFLFSQQPNTYAKMLAFSRCTIFSFSNITSVIIRCAIELFLAVDVGCVWLRRLSPREKNTFMWYSID